MSILDNIEVIEGGERRTGHDPVRIRRRKLAAGLAEQSKLIDALELGEVYRRAKLTKRQNLETDEVVATTDHRAVTPWWHVDDAGKVHFALRYGAMRLKVKDGKNTFVLPALSDLRQLLPPLRQEVLTGSLDAALADAAAGLQSRFKTKKPPKKA